MQGECKGNSVADLGGVSLTFLVFLLYITFL